MTATWSMMWDHFFRLIWNAHFITVFCASPENHVLVWGVLEEFISSGHQIRDLLHATQVLYY